jgi:hypothetical protein
LVVRLLAGDACEAILAACRTIFAQDVLQLYDALKLRSPTLSLDAFVKALALASSHNNVQQVCHSVNTLAVSLIASVHACNGLPGTYVLVSASISPPLHLRAVHAFLYFIPCSPGRASAEAPSAVQQTSSAAVSLICAWESNS